MRARNIKPSFFKNEDIGECSHLARLLFIGLWCMAYHDGILENRPKKIKAEVFPYDDKINIGKLLDELRKFNFISIRYEKGTNREAIVINKFAEHQRPHRNEKKSDFNELQDNREISSNDEEFPSPLLNDVSCFMNDECCISSEQNQEINSPTIIEIPLIKRDGTFCIKQTDIDQWQETFPAVDIILALKKIKQWNFDNPKKRKTAAGIRKHVSGWIGKIQDNGGNYSPNGIKINSVHQAKIVEEDAIAKALLEQERRELKERDSKEIHLQAGN